MIVLSDSSPIIMLASIQYLNVLQDLYESIVITPEVYDEVAVRGSGLAGAREVTGSRWIHVAEISRTAEMKTMQSRFGIGRGESNTLILAKEVKADLVLIDDRQARKLAVQQGLSTLAW